MKKAAYLLLIPIAMLIFFFYFQEAVPGGYAYEESNETLTVYSSYQTEIRSYPLDADSAVALAAATLRNIIDRQQTILFQIPSIVLLIIVFFLYRTKIQSRDYMEMSGRIIYWIVLGFFVVTLAYLIYVFFGMTADIETWIERTDSYLEESQ
ncbi:hypothetical protein [Alkalicoccus daliensis]|uniref:Uncharacterized protein n=1 Tax=Alkalicoccus daliensis TaxID=745820 RepID=A0A1H0CYL5_9BACI|nr:hypothetical protein [Alkalicoccus daliensis]SDN62992.1 hypothetical protein SAMN04488053_102279 [Alkalicoccus daliensis]